MNQVEFNIGGKDRGFKFGLGALGDIIQHYNTNLLGLGRIMVNNPFTITPVILFYGHKHHCLRNTQKIDFTVESFQDWMDDMENPMHNKGVEQVIKIFADSIQKHLPKTEEVSTDSKNTEKKS